jgi:hypothetical protein
LSDCSLVPLFDLQVPQQRLVSGLDFLWESPELTADLQ